RHPRAAAMARVYRKMALRTGKVLDQLQALEGEARLAAHPAYRAALELERGRLFERQAQLGPAQVAYEAAVAGHRVEVAALVALAPLRTRAGEHNRLLEVERKLLELDPMPERRVVAWTRIATLLEERLGDDVAAADAYEHALAEDPGYLPALEGAGRIFQR